MELKSLVNLLLLILSGIVFSGASFLPCPNESSCMPQFNCQEEAILKDANENTLLCGGLGRFGVCCKVEDYL